jgi:hypothetical protein
VPNQGPVIRPLWTDALLTLRRDDALIAIFLHLDRPCIAATPLAELGDGPAGFAVLGESATSGRCGMTLWSGGIHDGRPPVAVGAGPSWAMTQTDRFWIAAGPEGEAPTDWDRPDDRRVPTAFDGPPLS